MDKQAYKNNYALQLQGVSYVAEDFIDGLFDREVLNSILPVEVAAGIKRVILLGSGNSHSAAGAAVPGVKRMNSFRKVNSPDLMDFLHYYPAARVMKGHDPKEVLVVALGLDGNLTALAQAVQKAKDMGVHTLFIGEGQVAEYNFDMKLCERMNCEMGRYYAGMLSVLAVGAALTTASCEMCDRGFAKLKADLLGCAKDLAGMLEEVDNVAFEAAVAMKDTQKYEVLADAYEGFTAQFTEANLIKAAGVYCDRTNSEEYAHISFMMRCIYEYGAIVFIRRDNPSFNRMVDTIDGCRMQQRPTLILTDGTPEDFVKSGDTDAPAQLYDIKFESAEGEVDKKDAIFCKLPKVARPWMAALIDFVPGALFAGYLAALNEK